MEVKIGKKDSETLQGIQLAHLEQCSTKDTPVDMLRQSGEPRVLDVCLDP